MHDVFLSYMLASQGVYNVRSWLVAAMCNGCRAYKRRNIRLTELPPGIEDLLPSAGDVDDAIRVYRMRQMLARLRPAHREILHRHYYLGETAPEIAASMGRSTRAIQKAIVTALRRARKLLE